MSGVTEAARLVYCVFKSQLLLQQNLSPDYIQGQLDVARRQLLLAIKQHYQQETNTMQEKPYVAQIDIIAAFRDAMAADNISTPDPIHADGELRRFHVEGDKIGSRNGWYFLYYYPNPYGLFGSWKMGITNHWSIKAKSQLTVKERRQAFEAFRKKQQERATALRAAQQKVAHLCAKRWQGYVDANPAHPYLVRKQIKPHCAKQVDDLLALPIIDIHGKLWSLQYIKPEGDKVLCFQGAKKGNFIPVHNTLQPGIKILICEGFSTGASLAELEPEACIIAAIDAGNLAPVAMNIRKQWPTNDIVICADDDRTQAQNVGLIKAQAAASAVRARLAKPQWPTDAPLMLSDFNDWMCWLNGQEGRVCFLEL